VSNHTPGPWIFDTYNEGSNNHIGYGILSESGEVNVTIHRRGYCPKKGVADCTEQAIANATLIAAAPDLLEMVQRVCDWDNKWPKYSDTTGASERELNKLCEDAAIVLAKAKGGQP